MLGFGGALREEETGTQGILMEPRRVNPPGADRDLGAGQVRQIRGASSNGNGNMATDAGMRRRAQIWAAEAGGWKLRATSG